MEISELLRRGNFTRSKLFLSQSHLSLISRVLENGSPVGSQAGANRTTQDGSVFHSIGSIQKKFTPSASRSGLSMSQTIDFRGKDNLFFMKGGTLKDRQQQVSILGSRSSLNFEDQEQSNKILPIIGQVLQEGSKSSQVKSSKKLMMTRYRKSTSSIQNLTYRYDPIEQPKQLLKQMPKYQLNKQQVDSLQQANTVQKQHDEPVQVIKYPSGQQGRLQEVLMNSKHVQPTFSSKSFCTHKHDTSSNRKTNSEQFSGTFTKGLHHQVPQFNSECEVKELNHLQTKSSLHISPDSKFSPRSFTGTSPDKKQIGSVSISSQVETAGPQEVRLSGIMLVERKMNAIILAKRFASIQKDKLKQNAEKEKEIEKIEEEIQAGKDRSEKVKKDEMEEKKKREIGSRQSQIITQKPYQQGRRESYKRTDSSSSDDSKRKNKIFKNGAHGRVMEELRNEQGCEIYDIYGSFNDNLKQLHGQVEESIKQYSLGRMIIEQVEREKKQSRVIDVVENSIQSIFLALDQLELVPGHMQEREELDRMLTQFAITVMKSTKANIVIQIETVMIYANYCQEVSNFGKALRLFKQCKNMAISQITQRYRMLSYMNIGKCFQSLKLYPTALLYFGKCLEFAWFMNDKEQELNAYDLLGVTYYLLGDIKNASFYHEKMLQNDNEPPDSEVRVLAIKKIIEKLKKINSEEYSQKLTVNYKKFFAKVHSIDYEDDYECSSSDDNEFKLALPKTSSQKKNQDYEKYMRDQSPKQQRKAAVEKKRFIAIFNKEDRFIIQNNKKLANDNIRLETIKKNKSLKIPSSLQANFASAHKLMAPEKRQVPFMINQFSINRNLDNYMASDQRMIKNQNFDFFKLVDDTNNKKLKNHIFSMLNHFQSNLIFALSMIHSMRQRDKYSHLSSRRFAFSGVPNFNKHSGPFNIDQSSELLSPQSPTKFKSSQCIDKSKPNSNKQIFLSVPKYSIPNLQDRLINK